MILYEACWQCHEVQVRQSDSAEGPQPTNSMQYQGEAIGRPGLIQEQIIQHLLAFLWVSCSLMQVLGRI